MTGDQKVERYHDDCVENQTGDNFENNRSTFWSHRGAGDDPWLTANFEEIRKALHFRVIHCRVSNVVLANRSGVSIGDTAPFTLTFCKKDYRRHTCCDSG